MKSRLVWLEGDSWDEGSKSRLLMRLLDFADARLQPCVSRNRADCALISNRPTTMSEEEFDRELHLSCLPMYQLL